VKKTIAYIDDSHLNLELIETVFQEDFQVQSFTKANEFLAKFPTMTVAAILTDIHMPEMDGFALYEKIVTNPHYNGCPILFISSDDSDHAKIKSLELGAVDFISRFTGPEELNLRVKSKIQFYEKHRSIIEFGPLRLNLTEIKAFLNKEEVFLTFIEIKILCQVLRNYPDFVSKESIVENVWKSSHVSDANIYSHVFNLNSKIAQWDHEIITEKYKGIKLVKK
jgi:DNA-binding response OmpR family regulator